MTALEQHHQHTTPCGGDCRTCSSVGSCPDRMVCRCLQVTEETVITAIRIHGVETVKELRTVTGAGDGCMCCHRQLKVYLNVYSPSSSENKCCAK